MNEDANPPPAEPHRPVERSIAAASNKTDLPVGSTCAFCGAPLFGAYYRVGDRLACPHCAARAIDFVLRTRETPAGLARAAGAAFATALACGIAWTIVTQVSGGEWGILAVGIGWLVGRASLAVTAGQRGPRMATIAASAACFGVLSGKLFLALYKVRTLLVSNGMPPSLHNVARVFWEIARHQPSEFADPLDALWAGIAIFTAWRLCKSVALPVIGPIGAGGDLASANAALPRVPSSIPSTLSPPKQSSALRASTITLVSMLISIAVYAFAFHSWNVAIGFVLLILVHEMGHVVANLYYKMPASSPVFIPFVGAVITLRQQPPNAKVEAIIGIAGPVAGSFAALACFGWYRATGSPLALTLTWFGVIINLFNLLPVPPLDGGRVSAALSPWIWMLGVAGLCWMIYSDFREGRGVGMLGIILVVALPRIIATLRNSALRRSAYYRIGRVAPVMIGAIYIALLAVLIVGRWYTERLLPPLESM